MRCRLYKKRAEDSILFGHSVIDLTKDEDKPQRQSEHFGVSEEWTSEQMVIIKLLKILEVWLEFSDDPDLMPKPCLWMEWYDEMDALDGGKASEELRCWRAIMTLILSKDESDITLKRAVFFLHTEGHFTSESIKSCTSNDLVRILSQHVSDAAGKANLILETTAMLAKEDASMSDYHQQALAHWKGSTSFETHVTKVVLALEWAAVPDELSPITPFATLHQTVQEQLADWMPESKLTNVIGVLGTIGQYMDHEAALVKLKAFVSVEFTDKEKCTLDGIIQKIEALYVATKAPDVTKPPPKETGATKPPPKEGATKTPPKETGATKPPPKEGATKTPPKETDATQTPPPKGTDATQQETNSRAWDYQSIEVCPRKTCKSWSSPWTY
jgi:hypothetical protein